MNFALSALAVAAWWLLGYAACRRLARSWYEEFGSYKGMPTALLVFMTLFFGPLAWFVALADWALDREWEFGARVFGGER